jgi:uncharacterized protein YcbX
VVHVQDARGRVITSRSKAKLLLLRARLGADGEPLVDGRPWKDASVAADVMPLLVATDGAIAALGFDKRRFRPNLIVGGVQGLAEREWEGRRLQAGDAIIAVADLRQRCIMTTFDPDTAEQDVEVLHTIRREIQGSLALNCTVEKPGRVRVGDPVRLL